MTVTSPVRVLKTRGYRADDPIASLSQKAQEVLRASMRIVVRDGFAALTYAKVGAESGMYKDCVHYYFGGKPGLVQVLFDAAIHDTSMQAFASGWQIPPGVERVRTTVRASRVLPEAPDYLVLWELLPPVLRSHNIRQRVAELYEVYRSHYFEVFGVVDDPGQLALVRQYATLLIAMLDGLAIQKALDPDAVDLHALFDLWADIITESVDRRLAEAASTADPSASEAGEIAGKERAD